MKANNIKRMSGIALLIALVVVLQVLSGVIPPVGGFSISLVLIPIVLGGAIYGPGVGALLGAAFGAIVFINCVSGADPGGHMVLQAGPVLCFLVVMGKGILAGTLSAAAYRVLKPLNPYLAMVVAAIVCPVVNTGVFIVCMVSFFSEVLSAWAGGSNILGYVLSGLVLMNFVPEVIINIIFSPAGQRIVNVIKK